MTQTNGGKIYHNNSNDKMSQGVLLKLEREIERKSVKQKEGEGRKEKKKENTG